ncbi:uncharacterized protein PEZ65_016271 [Lycodopsis pacificus]
MWWTLCARTGLLSVAAVMLFSAAEVDASIHLPCCDRGRDRTTAPIAECYKPACRTPYFLVRTQSGGLECINQNSEWLKKTLEKGKMKCRPALQSSKRRSKVLDEDVSA